MESNSTYMLVTGGEKPIINGLKHDQRLIGDETASLKNLKYQSVSIK